MSRGKSKLSIVQVGDPVMRQAARALTPAEVDSQDIQQLIEDMRETLRAAPGVGLAAPQVGHSLRLAVIEDHADYHRVLSNEELALKRRIPLLFHVMINPQVVSHSRDTESFFEGCPSLTGYLARVRRAKSVKVVCLDERSE